MAMVEGQRRLRVEGEGGASAREDGASSVAMWIMAAEEALICVGADMLRR